MYHHWVFNADVIIVTSVGTGFVLRKLCNFAVSFLTFRSLNMSTFTQTQHKFLSSNINMSRLIILCLINILLINPSTNTRYLQSQKYTKSMNDSNQLLSIVLIERIFPKTNQFLSSTIIIHHYQHMLPTNNINYVI